MNTVTDQSSTPPADAFYSDSKTDEEGAAEESTESVDEENAENPTALIPLSALGKGAKEGDTITLKVKKIEGDEAIVELEGGNNADTGKDTSADDELETMASTNQKGY